MRTHSKRIKSSENDPQSEETSNYEGIPLDLEIEILKRLPVKSLGRFILVSKLWASIIHSRDLITPRLLIAFIDIDSQTMRQNWQFFSSSSTSPSASFVSRGACPFLNFVNLEYRSHYVNGLICLGYGREQTICDLSTGKSITLPRVKTRRRTAQSFFGYDPVNDQYKVLCMTRRMDSRPEEPSSEHQVFTLGAKQNSWRMIDCSFPHRPLSNGVCIDGVVYYIAYTGTVMLQRSIMRFDLKSENLDLFNNSPAGILYGLSTLINYKGKVALATKPSPYTFDVWIMDQDAENHEWTLKKSFSIEHRRFSDLSIACATHTGDIVLAPSYYHGEFYVVHYNPGKNSYRTIRIELKGDYGFNFCTTRAIVFSDYVGSVRTL